MDLTHHKDGRPTRFENFRTEQRDGSHEYGYRFKDAGDTLFEIVLGDEYLSGPMSEDAEERMHVNWSKFEWLAKAVVAAGAAELVVELLNHTAAYGSALECDHGFNGEEWAARAAAAVGWKGPRP